MKKLLPMLILLAVAGFVKPAGAQEINISFQPSWGPVGYDYVNFYYIPDIEAYYCVPTAQFTYFDGAVWITSPYLPPQYAGFDLYGCYKVVINEPTPWYHHDIYRDRYYGYRGRHDQGFIRDSHDRRYMAYRDERERRERAYHDGERRYRDEHPNEGRGAGRDEGRGGREGDARNGGGRPAPERSAGSGRPAPESNNGSGRPAPESSGRPSPSGTSGSGRPVPTSGNASGRPTSTSGSTPNHTSTSGGNAFGSRPASTNQRSGTMNRSAVSGGGGTRAGAPAAKPSAPAKGVAKPGKK